MLCSYVGCTREPAVKMGLWENTTTQTTKTIGTIPQRMAQEMHQRGTPPDSSFQQFKFPISRFPGTMDHFLSAGKDIAASFTFT